MLLIRIARTTVVAAALMLAAGLGTTASAAVTTPLASRPFVAPPTATQVHWEYRHHHRYWVPDRRHGEYRR